MTNIMERVQKHYDKAVEHYGAGAVLGVFCYGSWNYNTALENSDVDTKCILIPNLYSLAIKPYEVKHLHVDDEVCECMSIMHMVANWKKQNINFVEIMFTDYCIINPLYQEVWYGYFKMCNREAIARYDLRQAVHSMVHQAIHTIKQDPTDPKKVMNGLRIARTLFNITQTNKPYKECIWMEEDVREQRLHTPDPKFVEIILMILEDYRQDVDMIERDEAKKECINSYMEELILDTIKYRMQSLQ